MFIYSPNEILSVGRDGRLCTYHFISNEHCELTSTGKIRKRIDNVEELLPIFVRGEEDNQVQLYAMGFYGDKLVVEGLDVSAQFLSIKCGGMHRPHHFLFLPSPNSNTTKSSDPAYYTCTYLQKKTICIHQSSLLYHNRASTSVSAEQLTIHPPLHGLEINDVFFLSENQFLTGSEDTTMKFIEYQPQANTKLKIHQVLRGQASSIRTMAVSQRKLFFFLSCVIY